MQNEKLGYEISRRYSYELNQITNKLNQLERGRIYELSKAKMDGYLSTNIEQLRDLFDDLINKIQNGEEGESQKLSKYKDKLQF